MRGQRVVIDPPAANGGRRVRVGHEILGRAYGLEDLLEFCRRAGLDPNALDLKGELFEWRGGGPDIWPGATP